MSIFDYYVKDVPVTRRDGRGGTIDGTDKQLNIPAVIKTGVIGFVALICILIFNPFNSVPTGSRGVVTRFGKIVGIEQEGMVLLPPWESLALFSIRAEQADIKDAEGATADTQPAWTSLTVRYSIVPEKVAEVYEKYSHNGDLSNYVGTATHETFKAVTARYTAPDLIAKRQEVSVAIKGLLEQKLAVYGAQVINIDMTGFRFQDTYMHAINSKVEQEQLRLAAENKLLTVESEQKQVVAVASAAAGAVKAKADGDAYATIANAKAEAQQTTLNANAQAESIKVQQQALSAGQQVLELRRINVEQTKADKWDGALPVNYYASLPLPYFNATQYEHPKAATEASAK